MTVYPNPDHLHMRIHHLHQEELQIFNVTTLSVCPKTSHLDDRDLSLHLGLEADHFGLHEVNTSSNASNSHNSKETDVNREVGIA